MRAVWLMVLSVAGVVACGNGEPSGSSHSPKTLRLRLQNESAASRECGDVAVATYEDGVMVTIPLASGGVVPAGQSIEGTASFPHGQSISANGGCWRVGDPASEYVYGSFPITMTTNKDCAIIYSVSGEHAFERMECTDN